MFYNERNKPILSYCFYEARRYNEIENKFDIQSGALTNLLEDLEQYGLERTRFNGVERYRMNKDHIGVKDILTSENGRFWSKLRDNNVGINSKDDLHKFDISLFDLKKFMASSSDFIIIDKPWLEDWNVRAMSPRDWKKLAEFLEVLFRFNNSVEYKFHRNNVKGSMMSDITADRWT